METVTKLTAIKYGETYITEAMAYKNGDSTKKLPISLIIYLIEIADKKILIDAGCETMPGFELSHFTSPAETMRKAGIPPETVTDVILTHAHHDHAAAAYLFKNATIHVEKDEYKAALPYLPSYLAVNIFENEFNIQPSTPNKLQKSTPPIPTNSPTAFVSSTPSVPSAPTTASVPSAPSVFSAPTTASVPSAPTTASVPSAPSVFSASATASVPSAPTTASVPSAPTTPTQNASPAPHSIRAMKIGGHSKGSCIVEFFYKGKPHVICGDECYVRRCLDEKIPTGATLSVETSLNFVKKYGSGEYVTHLCHDPFLLCFL